MFNQIDYTKNFHQLMELTNQSSEKRLSFFRHVQLATVSALAILVALPQNVSDNQNLRILFVLAILSLSLAILTTGVAIYALTNLAEKVRKAYHAELERATNEFRKMEPVFVRDGKISKLCRKCSYILLVLSLFLLTLFAVFNVLQLP